MHIGLKFRKPLAHGQEENTERHGREQHNDEDGSMQLHARFPRGTEDTMSCESFGAETRE